MNNNSSDFSNRRPDIHIHSICHSKPIVKSHNKDDTSSTQQVKSIQDSSLYIENKRHILHDKPNPCTMQLSRHPDLESTTRKTRKEYFFRIEDDLFNINNHLEKNIKYENGEMKASIINEKVPSKTLHELHDKSDSYAEKKNIDLQMSVRDLNTKNINPSSDSLPITSSLNPISNIHKVKIQNYDELEYSPSKQQDKHLFSIQAGKSQNYKTLTFKDTIEKNMRQIKLKTAQCSLDIHDNNDNNTKALNLADRKVCKVWSPKKENTNLQSKGDYVSSVDISRTTNVNKLNEHEIISAGSSLQDIKSKRHESGMLPNEKPPSNEKDLVAMHIIKEEKEGQNSRGTIRRSSRIPKIKRYPEEEYENNFDDISPRKKMPHVMKNRNGITAELWECKNCHAMFRSLNSLKSHQAIYHSFVCFMCDWKGSKRTEYESHMSTKHFTSADKCLACREEFINYDLYREHMINVHKTIIRGGNDSKASIEEAQQVNQKSHGSSNLENMLFSDNNHVLTIHKDIRQRRNDSSSESNEHENHLESSTGNKKCPYCPKSFTRQSRLVRHLNYHLGKKSFSCNICAKSFVEKSGLDAHMVTHNPVNAACTQCDKVFKTQRTLKRHLETHANKTYMCDICNKKFHHAESLRVHKLTHNEGGSGNTCDICNKDCKTAYYLQVHLKTKHGSAKFECKECQKCFKWKQSFNKHMQRFHDYPDDQLSRDPESENLTSNPSFKCEDCSQQHSSLSDLMKHQESHKNKFWACDLCGKHFKNIYTREKHMKIVHDSSDEQDCPHCGATFKNKTYLDQHINHVHTSSERIKCGQCENDFKTKANLRSHVKTVHGQKENKHTCEECGKSFASPKDLSRHQKVHTRVQDFECRVCHRLFSRKDNMTAHLRTHTEPSSNLPTKSISSETLHAINDEMPNKNVHNPNTFTVARNDTTLNSQMSPYMISQSQIRIPSLNDKKYNNSFPSSITSISRMPYQMITTESLRLPMKKDTHTSKPTCILTVPKASFSTPTSIISAKNYTNNTSPFVSTSNESFSITSSLPVTSSPSTSHNSLPSSSLSTSPSHITLASPSSSYSYSMSELGKVSDTSIEIKDLPDHSQAIEQPELQQDHIVIAQEILPLLSPTEAHFDEPHVVYILEDGSFQIEDPGDIFPVTPLKK